MKKMETLPSLEPAMCRFTGVHVTIQLYMLWHLNAYDTKQAMVIIENIERMEGSIFIIDGVSRSQTKMHWRRIERWWEC